MATLPGPMYALSLDPKTGDDDARQKRLISIHMDTGKHVALFTDDRRARRWIDDNHPTNAVLQPYELADKHEVIGFLKNLADKGDTHVCINPRKDLGVGGAVEIARFIERLEGLS